MEQEEKNDRGEEIWLLRLYVAGQIPKSITAFSNLKKFCEEYLKDRYRIEVIDLVKNPELAKRDQIIAVPTLLRQLPLPLKRIIGDLSNKEKILIGLDVRKTQIEEDWLSGIN